MRKLFLGSLVVSSVAFGSWLAGCGGSNPSTFADDGGTDAKPNPDDGGQVFDDVFTVGDATPPPPDTGPPPEVAVVYAHSPSTLYKLDPNTKAVSVVGDFKNCSSVIDMAIDENGNGYCTTFGAFYKLDLKTATCTQVSTGSYPNSLSFVPKGTLDPNAEALVGYFGSSYVRINLTTGAVTNVGALTGGFSSSGDIVSVKNGGTFLTVNGNSCNDCLLQVDPKTGNVVQNYGTVNHSSVFGLAFWAGALFGFDDSGQLFQITANGNGIQTQNINMPSKPPNLQFWGAGSTTSAPPTGADGGGIVVK
jgi:hypothetical protein